MDKDSMKVVILAGGLGTRLREETETKPKPMVPIGGKPILWHIMKIYSKFGFNKFVISAGYKSEIIKRYFLEYPYLNNDFTVDLSNMAIKVHDKAEKEKWEVTIVDSGADTQTGGRIKAVENHIKGRFLATYGDGVCDLNIEKLLNFHESQGKTATLTAVRPQSRFGEVEFGKDGARVNNFFEKPQTGEGWISGGFFVFEKSIFNKISSFSSVLERDVLEPLAKQGQLSAYKHEGTWRCMDTFREYEALNKLWNEGKAEWKIW